MINAEKYIGKILEVSRDFGFNKRDNKITKCNFESCTDCLFSRKSRNIDEPSCNVAKLKWLISECKEPIKLSKVEYEILRYLYKRDYRYITREKSERVIAFKGRPHKRDYGVWNTIRGEKTGYLDLYDFSNLFQFTNWENSEPTLIQEVLNNCEVANDA